jgi:hypothetical protein
MFDVLQTAFALPGSVVAASVPEEGSRRIRLGSYDCLFMIERIEG